MKSLPKSSMLSAVMRRSCVSTRALPVRSACWLPSARIVDALSPEYVKVSAGSGEPRRTRSAQTPGMVFPTLLLRLFRPDICALDGARKRDLADPEVTDEPASGNGGPVVLAERHPF